MRHVEFAGGDHRDTDACDRLPVRDCQETSPAHQLDEGGGFVLRQDRIFLAGNWLKQSCGRNVRLASDCGGETTREKRAR